ncbi:MAG TPA: SpoIIE family protein phosphatase, partial [Candidatus Rifleibacterium sp.]|nr:SpoIIE family protein phosphatase [Candidatus Rifleibacterium sp.]
YNRPGSNKVVEFCLAPDETLCLYTDGIAEVCAGNGDVLGYDGFRQMLQTSWQAQTEAFLETLLRNHSRWAGQPDDDQSVVLISRSVAC